jgi:RNA ligase (TIGR02306 family)
VHGSQGILLVSANGIAGITSKGYAKKDLLIEQSDSNLYWKSFQNAGLIDFAKEHFAGSDVQIFAEVIPCQGGYSYGQTTPTVRIFRFIVNSREWCYNEIVEDISTRKLLPLWVPLLYQGPLNGADLPALCQGKEQVSGKELHIREGIVISPEIPRRTRQGFPLYLKFINPKFKSNDNDVS